MQAFSICQKSDRLSTTPGRFSDPDAGTFQLPTRKTNGDRHSLFGLTFSSLVPAVYVRRKQSRSRHSSLARRQASKITPQVGLDTLTKAAKECQISDTQPSLLDQMLAEFVLRQMDLIAATPIQPRGFDGFVAHARSVGSRFSANDQKRFGVEVLRNSVPTAFSNVARLFFQLLAGRYWNKDSIAVLNLSMSVFAPQLSHWLVGRTRVLSSEEEAQVRSRQNLPAPSGGDVDGPILLIEKCKFLEAVGGCKGLCLNMCKAATEEYLEKDLGLPVYMDPNLEDYSCRMFFLKHPVPRDQDPVLNQPCQSKQCDGNFDFSASR